MYAGAIFSESPSPAVTNRPTRLLFFVWSFFPPPAECERARDFSFSFFSSQISFLLTAVCPPNLFFSNGALFERLRRGCLALLRLVFSPFARQKVPTSQRRPLRGPSFRRKRTPFRTSISLLRSFPTTSPCCNLFLLNHGFHRESSFKKFSHFRWRSFLLGTPHSSFF